MANDQETTLESGVLSSVVEILSNHVSYLESKLRGTMVVHLRGYYVKKLHHLVVCHSSHLIPTWHWHNLLACKRLCSLHNLHVTEHYSLFVTTLRLAKEAGKPNFLSFLRFFCLLLFVESGFI
jgi:hypothetical protein